MAHYRSVSLETSSRLACGPRGARGPGTALQAFNVLDPIDMIGYCHTREHTIAWLRRGTTTMFGSNDLLVTVLIRERERETARAAALARLLGGLRSGRSRPRSLRDRLGLSLIQMGRALL